MFGASNALFTGLSFVGVIIAILLQGQALKFQRHELDLTRKEMEQTREEFEIQSNTMEIQQFENTFFQMLSLFHENTRQISYSYKSHSCFGKEIFKSFLDRMLKNLDDEIRNRFYRWDDVPNDENYKKEIW